MKLEQLTEEDRLNLADIAWFLRGLNFGKEKSEQPFDHYHFTSLERVIEAIREHEIESKKEPLKAQWK